jgi:DNA-binding beta-propeller fold protein YncE
MRKATTRQRAWAGLSLGLAILSGLIPTTIAAPADSTSPPYRSPFDIAYSPDGKLLAVSDRTAPAVTFIDAASGKVAREAKLTASAGALVWSADSSRVYVTEYETATVAEINAADAKVLRRLPVGPYPIGLALAAKKQLLLVGNTAFGDVSILDLATGKEKARIKAVREPFWISITPDESTAVVSNLLPAGSAIDPQITAAITLIDLNKLERTADIKLPPNSTGVRQNRISPDGQWAYVVHSVGRANLPATQLDRGWVNTDGLSIIDLKDRKHYATILLDNISEGAADPWGLALTPDASTLWITIAGTHQLAKVDLANLHKGLTGGLAQATGGAKREYASPTLWNDIKSDPNRRFDLVNDLAAMYIANLLHRIPLPAKAPRGIALSPDGKQLAVTMYFSNQVLLLDAADGRVLSSITPAPDHQPDEARRGESVFHDATSTFQHWLSCATCHPNEGRVDGLNWDLPNDGIGNPKNNKSLLYAHLTPPSMWLGIREDMDSAAAAGFRFAQRVPPEEDLNAVRAYIRSLKPLRSPYRLANGDLSEKAQRGKALFDNEKNHCAGCHSGEVFTNLKKFDVGTQSPLDYKEHVAFDTPTLIEIWRTAPYLHDGRATTLHELFTTFNPNDKHGVTSPLSKEQLDDLVEYLLSL